MVSNKIHCVLFDAVGTLIYPYPPVAEAYRAVALRHGSSLTDAEIGEFFRRAFRRQETLDTGPSGCETDERRERRRWQAIVSETLTDVSDSLAAFGELWRHFSLSGSWRLFDDVANTWQALAGHGLRLGIASNFDGRLLDVCRGLPPLDACRDIFVSGELGVRKPAYEFFRRVEQRLQLAPEQILLVGDDLTNDYHAARQAGWHALLLDRRDECGTVQDSVRSLREIDEKFSKS